MHRRSFIKLCFGVLASAAIGIGTPGFTFPLNGETAVFQDIVNSKEFLKVYSTSGIAHWIVK